MRLIQFTDPDDTVCVEKVSDNLYAALVDQGFDLLTLD
jgi:hypothetical protein